MILETLHTMPIQIAWCPYCRKGFRGTAVFWRGQPKLRFDTRQCAEAWAKTLRDKDGNETFPGMTVDKVNGIRPKRSVKAWIKKVFGGNS